MQKGKLYAPDLADGFKPGQIRALPFLNGALEAYRRQGTSSRPDTSTVQEPKASAPMVAVAGEREAKPPPPPELDGRSPLGRGHGLGKTHAPAGSLSGSSVINGTPPPNGLKQPDGSVRPPPLTRSAPRMTASDGRGKRSHSVTSSEQNVSLPIHHLKQKHVKPLTPNVILLRYIDKPQELELEAGGGEESPPHGVAALPLPLPLREGAQAPSRKPQNKRQGRIIDIMLNYAFWPISQSPRDPPIFSIRRISARILRLHVVGCPPIARGASCPIHNRKQFARIGR